jgi:hypothetical protein
VNEKKEQQKTETIAEEDNDKKATVTSSFSDERPIG